MEKKISKTVYPDKKLDFNEWHKYTKASNMYVSNQVKEKFDSDNNLPEIEIISFPFVYNLEQAIVANIRKFIIDFKLNLIKK